MDKRCKKCEEIKPLNEFGNRGKSADGKEYQCKVCRKLKMQEWKDNNKDKVLGYVRKSNKQWYDNRTNQMKENKKESNKKWYSKNVSIVAAHNAKRRALKLNATPSWTNIERIKVIYKMAYKIRQTGVNVHVDHIVPLKHELVCGLHVPDNLRIIPQWENDSKNNKFEVNAHG